MSAISDNEAPVGTDEGLGEFTKYKNIVKSAWDDGPLGSKWRTEAKRAFNFVASRQWDETDEAKLRDENRAPITFNRTEPIVKAICGLEVNNRQSVIYLPRTLDDAEVNESITAAGKFIRDETNAEDKESKAFRDSAICGVGCTEMRMEFDEKPEGKVVKEKITPMEMGVNVGSKDPGFTDARVVFRVRDMDIQDAKELDGMEGLSPEAMHAGWLDTMGVPADGGEGFKKDYPEKTRAGIASVSGRRPKTVRIIQVQYWERKNIHLVAQEGVEELQELSPEDFKKFEKRAEMMNNAAALDISGEAPTISYKATKTKKKVYYECFLVANAIVGKRVIEQGMFQWQFITGDYDEEGKMFYGVVRPMFDPQMWANKWLSQTINIMNANAKGGLLAETDAFQNIRKAERDWADPTKIVWVKPGTLAKGKIKERQPIALPPGLDQLMMFAISSIRDVTGVNLELLGQADREQAASLEMQRRQSAMTVLASLFDSLRQYRKRDGKLTLHFIWMLPDNTLIRILDKGKHKYIPLVKDGDVEQYDVIIDEAPSSPDQKMFIWQITSQVIQMGILPPPAVVALLKYSPFPESVVKEIQDAMGMGSEMPPAQMKMKLDQAEQALKFLEGKLQEALEKAKEAEDDKSVELLKVAIDKYEAETTRLKELWAAQAAGAQASQEIAEEVPNDAEFDIESFGGPSEIQQLNQKVDALAGMFQQFLQQAGAGQPAPEQMPTEELM